MIHLLKTEKECIEYIHSLKKFGKKAGLDNIRYLMDKLGNVQDHLKCIHVAGTNGKGSVSGMITNVLINHGYKVGLNTSPYIEFFNERIQINNKNIPPDKLVYYTNKIKNIIDADHSFNPIEFEVITAIGFVYFYDEKCDFVVLETGLGGRFDATNIIKKPIVSVICAIGLDHTEILGDTTEKIAYEKCGIIKDGCPVAVYPKMESGALEVIKKSCKDKKSKLFKTDRIPQILSSQFNMQRFIYNYTEYTLNVSGKYQVYNAALAIDALNALNINLSQGSIISGIADFRLKCRYEVLKTASGKKIIIDGAHNIHGIDAFCKSTEQYFLDKSKVIVYGMLNDKNYKNCAQKISALKNAHIIVCDVPSYRQTSAEDIFDEIKKHAASCEYISDYKSAVDKALKMQNENTVSLVCGSLYLGGAVRGYVLDNN